MRAFILVTSLVVYSTIGMAEAPDWFINHSSTCKLAKDATLPGDSLYAYPSQKLVIDPVAVGATSLALSFDPGATISTTSFEVANGGKLHFKGCQLVMVSLICLPGGEITLEDCTTSNCYFTKTATSAAATGLRPRVRVQGCKMTVADIESPALTGIEITDSFFYRGRLEATQGDGSNTTSSYSQCEFVECVLQAPEVIMATRNSAFKDCNCVKPLDDSVGSYLASPILVQLSWHGGTPSSLPAQAGKVHFGMQPAEPANAPRVFGASRVVPKGHKTSQNKSLAAVVELLHSGPAATKTVATSSSVPTNTPRPTPSASPAAIAADITSTAVASGITFKSRIVGVNGLLISQLSSGEEAGQVTKMSLTALPSLGESPSTLKFNQKVGPDMEKALHEVSKFAQLRHGGLPAGHAVELGFADKYISKDGPSAAVACALLLEGAITGKE